MHGFYDSMCPQCGDLNYHMRSQHTRVSMESKIAVVTGGRIKIGYEIVMQLLSAGCTVIVTTRFLEDAKIRFSLIPQEWRPRLHLVWCVLALVVCYCCCCCCQ